MTGADAPDPGWLTALEAARYLRCSQATVLRAARTGRVRAFRLQAIGQARTWRFRRADLDAWLMTSATPTPYEVRR